MNKNVKFNLSHDGSHNRATEGTGLGLAIVKSILEGHECSYWIQTQLPEFASLYIGSYVKKVQNTVNGICTFSSSII